jgi:hypothetical protein
VIYDYGISTSGRYTPAPHYGYLGANNAQYGVETGSFIGAVYRNVWLANKPRPASLGTALSPQ